MAYQDVKGVLTDNNFQWNAERSPLKSSKVINDISKIVQEEGGEKLPEDSGILRTRFEVFRFVASQYKGYDLDDPEKKKAFESVLKIALEGDTLQASWPPKDEVKCDEPVVVKRGRVLRIYKQSEVAPVGYIRTSDGSIVKFGQEHFVADFPLPLQAGDEVSYLVGRKTSSMLGASIRVTTYEKPIDLESANKFLLYVKGADKDLGCLFRALQYHSFFKRILSDDQLLSDQNGTVAKEIIRLSASSIVIQFPIESEREKEYNKVFTDEDSSVQVDRSEQKKFLRMFSRCSLFECISQSDDLDEQFLLKAFKLILALLREFPGEREHICDAVISLASKLSPEKSVKVWNLVFFTVSRPSADVYTQSWRNVPEMMSFKEFQTRLETKASDNPRLEVVKPTYSSREEYFDTYYKLLREDTYRELCSTIYRSIHKQPNRKEDAIYKIEFRGVEISRTGGSCCRVRYTPCTDAVKQEGKENSLFLHSGNLFCILSHSGDFWSHKKGDVLFAVKEMEDNWCAERDSDHPMRYTVLLRFLPFGDHSEVEAIEMLRFSKNAVMVESPVFFRAYEPVLQALQTMDTRCLPFESELLRREHGEFDGEYLTPDTEVNIGPFLESTEVVKCPIGQVREKLSERKECVLDKKQLAAVECIVKNRLAIVQGPPGTGKSFIAAKVIESLLSLKKTPIVIMAYKNRALDHLLNACYKFSKGGIVRLGKLSEDYAEGRLKKCLLREQMKTFRQPHSVNDPFERKLDVLQKSIRKAWEKLEKASGDDQKFDLTDCWKLLEDDEDRKKLLTHLVGVGDFKRAAEKDNKEMKRAESELQEIVKSNWGREAQSQQEPSDNSGKNESSDVSSDVVEDDEAGEEIEKERNLDCGEDDEFLTEQSDEDEPGSTTMNVLGSTTLIASNSVEKTGKELKDAMNVLTHSEDRGNEENFQTFWRKFYYFLAAKRYEAAKTELEALLKEFSTVRDELAKSRLPTKISLLRKAKIVAMTTTKAAIEHQLLNMLQPQIVVIEEGGGVLEPNLLACLTPNTKHLIMIGDHKQIGPKVVSEELRKEHKFGVSLLERLADPSKFAHGEVSKFPHITLDTQSRMNPKLLDLFQEDYGEGFQLKTREIQSFQPPACMKKCKVWWTYKEGRERQRSGKVYNQTEAKMAASYCYWLFSEGFGPKDVALLTPYSAQVQEIKKSIQEIVQTGHGWFSNQFEEFLQCVFTVDSFQGHESDIVILSLVRKNNKSTIGFLSDRTRQVVALSRQRRALCIIGCQQHMEKSPGWKKRLGAFGPKNIQETLQVSMGKECIEVSTANELIKLVTERLSNRRETVEKRYLPSPDEERAMLREQVYNYKLNRNTPPKLLQRMADIIGADWKAVIRKAANMREWDIEAIEADYRKLKEQGFQALQMCVENASSPLSIRLLLDELPEQKQQEVIQEVQKSCV